MEGDYYMRQVEGDIIYIYMNSNLYRYFKKIALKIKLADWFDRKGQDWLTYVIKHMVDRES